MVFPKTSYPSNNGPSRATLLFSAAYRPRKGLKGRSKLPREPGLPLKIAAKIDTADESYWREVVGPMVAAHPNVEFIGEINEHQKADFLGNARALLFPIDWPEPFGLVMIEAMACGTPVIAFESGSVPEVIDDGISGFVVGSIAEAVSTLDHVATLSRRSTRDQFEQRFTAERMAQDYLAAYRHLPRMHRLEPRLELVSA